MAQGGGGSSPRRDDSHNQAQIQKAVAVLDRLMREKLASNSPGSVGVRIPFQRSRFGNIREIREDER